MSVVPMVIRHGPANWSGNDWNPLSPIPKNLKIFYECIHLAIHLPTNVKEIPTRFIPNPM